MTHHALGISHKIISKFLSRNISNQKGMDDTVKVLKEKQQLTIKDTISDKTVSQNKGEIKTFPISKTREKKLSLLDLSKELLKGVFQVEIKGS